jgi:cephalosporin-C deacetylase-like acetyl esterase
MLLGRVVVIRFCTKEKLMRTASVLAAVLLAAPAMAQENLTVLSPKDNEPSPRKLLALYLRAEAQKDFDARRAGVAALKTPDDVSKRQHLLRTKFIEALGGFPDRTPLNAKVLGTEKRDGYSFERIVYESRPSHHVTATLYMPEGKGPFPGVLMPIGHSSNGKAADYVQRGCILLAKNGIAALAYDPIGQGERIQLLDPNGKPTIGGNTTEHTMADVGALLVGRSTATYRIWDGMRSLDYLASRPEIDAKKLGCTGCSGGGTLTAYLMALDDRIVCAAPSCYITSLERLFATIGPQDGEQNIPGQVAFGMEHADYLALRAPKPTLLLTNTKDFFDIQGSWTTFREAKGVYGILGRPECVDLAEFNQGHGYPKEHREAAVRWMRRWMLDKNDAIVEGAFPIEKDATLQCTRSGQVMEDYKDKSVFDLNALRETELAAVRAKFQADHSRDELLKEVRRLIALRPLPKLIKALDAGELRRDGYTIRKLVYETEPGIKVPALQFVPNKGRQAGIVLYLPDKGMAAAAAVGGPMEKLVNDGREVLALDARGFGETAPAGTSKKPNYFGEDYSEIFISQHLNRPLLGQRVYDVLTILDALPEKDDASLIGVGTAAPIALHAAALDTRIKEVTLDRGVLSWSAVVRTPVSINQLTNVVPGVLAVYDLPDLAATIAPRPLTIRGTVDPADKPVSQEQLDAAYKTCKAAYVKEKAEKRFTLLLAP